MLASLLPAISCYASSRDSTPILRKGQPTTPPSVLPLRASFEWASSPGPPPRGCQAPQTVQFLDDDSRLHMTLPASKTDPFRVGITITIAAASDAACPVKSLRHLFDRYPRSHHRRRFRFHSHQGHRPASRHLARAGCIRKLFRTLLSEGCRNLGPLHWRPGRRSTATGPLEI
jgi:hypothetical protein